MTISFNNTLDNTMYELEDILDIEYTHHNNMIDINVADDETFTLANGIVSHNSAIGPLVNVRRSNKIGGYPLRGKILNVDGMSFLDIMKIEVISELMSIIGLELGKKPKDLNYGKIILMTDADVDGISIRGLLFRFFNLWGDALFKENRIYIIKTPLLMAKKGTDIKLYYSFEEYNLDAKQLKGYEITYFKGLGTMPVEVYDECINNPKLIPIMLENEDDQQSLNMAFGDDSNLRKKWLLNN